jgi:hypothetical protein
MTGDCCRWTLAASLTVALAMVAVPVKAMQFHAVSLDEHVEIIEAMGPIISGDTDRLRIVLRDLPPTKHISAITLDSPGGSLTEAQSLADFARTMHGAVGVLSGAKCASACFLIFAAGNHRFMAADALIGVHSASEQGSETVGSVASTMIIAREAVTLGVPPLIVSKMVQTPPGRMEWLTPQDLALMDVKIFEAKTPAQENRGSPSAIASTVSRSEPQSSAARIEISGRQKHRS